MRPRAKTMLAGRRILIVEDEYFLADDLRQILSEQHAEVLGPVPTTAEALALVHNDQPIDCAVLDVNLGGKAVFPISVALMERKIPFLFATGYGKFRTNSARFCDWRSHSGTDLRSGSTHPSAGPINPVQIEASVATFSALAS
jgi:CheY-like chemotaxis protein